MSSDAVNNLPGTHDHVFGQDRKRPGESKTFTVVLVTFGMMLIEVSYGLLTGSMALLADGLHMASHAAALGINLFAYHYARRHARSDRFSFGTGKVNAMGGYTGAVLLGVFAAIMLWESAQRLFRPVDILYTQAIWVACIGLLVNGASVLILQGGTKHRHDHAHDHHDHPHDRHDHTHDADEPHHHHHHHERHPHHHTEDEHHHDHNLKSAYLHVLADALTSFLAIGALLAAKYGGWTWMDPAMGIVGAVLILRWSQGLLRATSSVLLDHQGPAAIRGRIRRAVLGVGPCRVLDLHLWLVAPRHYAAIVHIETSHRPGLLEDYRAAILRDCDIAHLTIEIRPSG